MNFTKSQLTLRVIEHLLTQFNGHIAELEAFRQRFIKGLGYCPKSFV
ncbi:MAG: hypothetical protein AAGF01_02055 [Cyanobacteria bacterium P01_G01_bin.38]